MPPPEARLRIGECDVLLLGTVAGFVPDAERVQAAFAAHAPERLALGVPPEDIPALERLRAQPEVTAELDPPDAAADRLLALLARFGPTRIPSPDLEAAYSAAHSAGIPVAALDLDDVTHSAEYVRRVKVRHLWIAPRREKRLLARPFDSAGDAYALALQWDDAVNRSRPLREMEELREAHMAQRVRDEAAHCRRLLAILPVARLEGVERRLRAAT